ncbi:dual specificity testis-specific protein kinase 2-like [Babylonia areolata]|uniref:dual specificity testis-specific protein kinase 2-like n=1 Tax=Babylonia areolata TaxID=304850 RepID=UPI003FD3D09B
MTAKMEKSPSSVSSKRPLRRSRTINCNVYPADHPASQPVHENGGDENSDKRDGVATTEHQSPKSSCQALRHAVSALTRLDDFICEKIGAGFFSEVFKVTHRITGQVMALKMNTMTSNRHNMLREVQLLNRLQHSNILRFMGVCVHEGQLHALTEFIPNGSLEQLLGMEEEELPWTQRIHLTLGLSRGLDYLHSRGFLHRDLTSKNILVKREEHGVYQAVLADFGLATKIPDPLSREKLPTVGSPYWMAPEVLNGRFYNERADLFSVGIIMCEITARITADPDVMPRMENFGVDYVALSEMISYCPLDYLQLAFKCCQVDPAKRPQAVEIIEWLEKIFKNLQNDIYTRQEKEKKTERNGHKRSRSEDNILQANDSETDTSSEDIVITPLLIGQVMSRDDPSYAPSSNNPFAAIQRFQHGRKLLGTSIDFATELPSPANLFTPPSTPGQRGRDDMLGTERRCQSLPSSPVLLRRAAEKLHQESLHGSARYYHRQQQPQTLHAVRVRSKSTVFSDAFAQRLQWELLSARQQPPSSASASALQPLGENLTSTEIPESETEHCGGACEEEGEGEEKGEEVVKAPLINHLKTVPPPAPPRKGNSGGGGGGGGGGDKGGEGGVVPPVPTATRRRAARRLKYQSLDGDVVGVPPIAPPPPTTTRPSGAEEGVGGRRRVRTSPSPLKHCPPPPSLPRTADRSPTPKTTTTTTASPRPSSLKHAKPSLTGAGGWEWGWFSAGLQREPLPARRGRWQDGHRGHEPQQQQCEVGGSQG